MAHFEIVTRLHRADVEEYMPQAQPLSQCGGVCCSVTLCCIVSQCVAVCCSMLQCVAMTYFPLKLAAAANAFKDAATHTFNVHLAENRKGSRQFKIHG